MIDVLTLVHSKKSKNYILHLSEPSRYLLLDYDYKRNALIDAIPLTLQEAKNFSAFKRKKWQKVKLNLNAAKAVSKTHKIKIILHNSAAQHWVMVYDPTIGQLRHIYRFYSLEDAESFFDQLLRE